MKQRSFKRPSGKLVQNKEGKLAFLPNPLPPLLKYDNEITILAADAHAKLGELSGIGRLLPNPHLLILPYLRREAILSSKIEGTQASLSDLFIYEATKKVPQAFERLRLREVSNYVKALEDCWAQVRKSHHAIDSKLIRFAHKELLAGVRGEESSPGSFRKIQVWIGKTDNIEEAEYVPPPPELIDEALVSLESFMKNPPPDIPVLIQCALMHYQFEAIHPFVDGNGRIGRLLIPLFLCEKRALSQPLLYLSEYFETNNEEYNIRMRRISLRNEWNEWLKFFLKGVASHATEAIKNIQRLLRLRLHYEKQLRLTKAPKNAMLLLECLFFNPYTTVKNASEYLHVTFKTAQRTIDFMVKVGILEKASDVKRNRLYVARQIDKILQSPPSRPVERHPLPARRIENESSPSITQKNPEPIPVHEIGESEEPRN